uniref:PHD-type domain-containing protein n=1 Tax=Angiostrongylus cantonensis TaxID=6313 RepID=A0A0K0DM07_ANGCA
MNEMLEWMMLSMSGHQSYLNQTVVTRGWRCLDCTICEGCGEGKDESKLLLCEECDVSYHIYCLSPPLERIPNGPWRCHWCCMCQVRTYSLNT